MSQMISGIPYRDGIYSKVILWNTETLAWEPSTMGSGAGQAVSVENFPAVISGSVVPINGEVDIGLTSQYALKMAEDSVHPDTISYVGEAVAGSSHLDPVWRIKKLDTTTGTIITWADGNNNFDNIFADRESLNYS